MITENGIKDETEQNETVKSKPILKELYIKSIRK